jgi:ARG/rhodanese/phosphatase superfamily protein/protein kinase-like protein
LARRVLDRRGMTLTSIWPELTLGPCARRGSVTVLPVFARAVPPPTRYDLGIDALASGTLEISEQPEAPAVDRLLARNHARRRVLLLDGDHLRGARQNRMLISSALIGGDRAVTVPVSCVEQHRWQGPTTQFEADATAGSARVRQIAKLSVTRSLLASGPRRADQSGIWHQIAAQQRSLHVVSATWALSHTYAARAPDLAAAAGQLTYPAGAIGVALGVGDDLVSIDVFDLPAICERYWRRLVAGAVLEGLAAPSPTARVGGADVRRVLDELCTASWSRVPAVGDGDELRTATPLAAAAALMLEGQLVHLGIATRPALGAEEPRRDAPPRAALSSPGMRHALPEPLAARFRIVGQLGIGGAKKVFRAVDTRGGPDVAIAWLPGIDPHRFRAEVALTRRVTSAYAPQILEVHVDDYHDGYIVMERCDGPSLAQLIAGGPLAIDDAAPILVAFARGLRAIHEVAVLHRDIKLENVMMCASDAGPQLKILDFGLAAQASSCRTDAGRLDIGGTLPYMAHEVLRGLPVDARSDVFAFGVCCFRLLTGQFPVPPHDHESELAYLVRLRDTPIDPGALPARVPPTARAVIGRMLDAAQDARPFMPEVVAVLEHAFGAPSLAPLPPVTAARPAPLERAARLALSIASAEHVLIAACPHAPIVTLTPDAWGVSTEVRAIGVDGGLRWRRQLAGHLVTGIRADLDGDGARELYLAGRDRVVALGVTGAVRFTRANRAPSVPGLLALAHPGMPRLVVDGQLVDITSGADLGTLAMTYRGDGRELVTDDDPRGMAYHGLALQGFCGDHGTAAAIVADPGDARFLVAQLEDTRGGRIHLSVYGPGGGRLHQRLVAECQLDTGDLAEISRIYDRRAPLFGTRHAPLAVMGPRGTAAVIVPLLDPPHGVPATLVAFELPSGRELWRHHPESTTGRALLADLHGDGAAQLVIGDGRALVVYDPWTGRASAPIECQGVPVAFGDPFASGFAHVITASPGGVELWRGPPCSPGAMAWTGARGDLWRTGTLRSDGTPFGPV